MRFQICLLLLQIIFCNHYELANSKAIVGNNVRHALEGEFPSVVSIKLINKKNPEPEKDHGASGVIVSKRHILTVAHGVIKVSVKNIEVVVGSIDIRSGKRLTVARIITYNDWAGEKNVALEYPENDIALLLLSKKIPDSIDPSFISFEPKRNLFGKDVVTAGWGRTINGKARYMDTVALKVLTDSDCSNRLAALTNVTSTIDKRYICSVANPFAFIRKGDSGGPLFFNGELVAINKATSPFSDDHLIPGKVNLHILMQFYMCFILDNIRKY